VAHKLKGEKKKKLFMVAKLSTMNKDVESLKQKLRVRS
jgi:hypothetical protein